MDDKELAEIRKRKLEKLMGGRSYPSERSYPNDPVALTEANFDDLTQKYPIVVVDCYADWCAPCRMIAPIIDELAGEFIGKVVFGRLDIDKNMRIAQRFGIQSIPTLLVFKNGELIDQVIGALPKDKLSAYVRQIT